MQTKIIEAHRLQTAEIKRMFELMGEYYEGASFTIFAKDLSEKQKVILLLSPAGTIEGFSTIAQENLIVDGRKFISIYSGDTVLSRKYWGNGALAMAFGRYLFQTKLRNPFTDVDWFLISKGYKTYLLMTNNFPNHYPRFESDTPATVQKKMDLFYGMRFGSDYSPEKGLIRLDQKKSYHLKPLVAEITDELRSNPRIAFFEMKNPQWHEGMELACLAKVSFWIPIRYTLKRLWKFSKKLVHLSKKTKHQQQGESYASHQTQQRVAGDRRSDDFSARNSEASSGVG